MKRIVLNMLMKNQSGRDNFQKELPKAQKAKFIILLKKRL